MKMYILLKTFSFFCICNLGTSPLHAAIHIGFWNVSNNPDNEVEDTSFSTVLSAMDRPDVYGLAETDTGSLVRFTGLLNDTHATTTYSSVSGASLGGDRTALVYDTSTVSLVSSFEVTTDLTRPTIVGTFRPVGTTGDSDFSVVSVHLLSGSSSTDQAFRAGEAESLFSATIALPNVIYGGDFNILGSSEAQYDTFTQDGFDLADAPGEYRDNIDFLSLHTQNPAAATDDRFDLIFASNDFRDGQGLEFVEGSYGVFGNNGTHTLNESITTGTGASPEVLTALTEASDHLPIFATFNFVPEPSSGLLAALGGTLLFIRRRNENSNY